MATNPVSTSNFLAAFNRSFIGILRWPQLDEFWSVLRADASGGWYVYAVGEAPPRQPATAEAVEQFITHIDQLLRKEYQEEHCGLVYVDDRVHPTFVKILDPNNLGVVCGYSKSPPLPGWVLSKIPPVDLNAPGTLPGNRKRWWSRVFR